MATALYLMPTQRCNGACTYCYLPERERQKDGDDRFFLSVLEKFIADLQGFSSGEEPQLRFIGGEPYLKPELLSRLTGRFQEAFPRGLVVFNTNGTLIARAEPSISVADPQRVVHIISLDGPEKIHNARRRLRNGGNAYRAAVAGIDVLQRRGLPVYLNMVLDQHSVDGLADLFALVKSALGLHTLSVSLLSSPVADLPVTQKYSLLCRAYELAEKYGFQISGHHRLLLGRLIPELRCRAGEKTVLVTSDGCLTACQRFVGRQTQTRKYRPDIHFASLCVGQGVEERCYARESGRLGEMMYALYQKQYPRYLQALELDRVLFGVI